jgi:hypothetical protein
MIPLKIALLAFSSPIAIAQSEMTRAMTKWLKRMDG